MALVLKRPMKFRKNHQKSGNIHFQRVPNLSLPPHIGGSGPIQEKSQRLCHFWGLPLPFWKDHKVIHTNFIQAS